MAKKGFTGSEIYFQDKFDEFDFWSRYNNMRPKEGWNQMLQDYKDSTKMEEDEWGKPPPIPLSVLKSGLGYILKQLAGGKFNQGKRDFLEKIVKPPKPKPKVEKIEPFKFPSDKQIKKDLDKIFAEIYSKHSTKHAEGGIAGMLGEPRSGYQDGGLGIAKEKWDRVKYLYRAAGGFKGTGKSLSEFGSDVLFQIDRQEGPYFREGGRIGYAGGGAPVYSESDYPHLLSPFRPGGQKPSLSDYDEDVWDLDYIEIPMSGSMKKMKKKKGKGKKDKAEGGRIGLADGDTPSQAWMRDYFYKSGKDRLGVISVYEYIHGGQGWSDYMDHGPGKAKGGRIGYDNGGPVTQEEYDEYVAEKEAAGEEAMDFETYKLFKIQFPMAAGGRIGFQDGRGIMSRVGDMVDVRGWPYYAGEGLKGLVNSVETLSKFPLAAAKLTSDLIQKPGFKKVPRETSDDEMTELFMQQTGQDYKLKPTEVWGEALENITPGSWSENLGLTSLIEGMEEKRPDDAKTVGNLLGLGTEVAVPTGGAFKAGQLLLSKASKAMGKIKDGKTLNKLVDEKLTDSGQSRRDFNTMAATSGLMVALKSIGLGGLFKAATKVKPSDDVVIRLRTFIDDSDVDTEWGPVAQGQWAGAFDIESLSKAAQKTMEKLMMPVKEHKGIFPVKGTKEGADSFTDIPLEDGSYILEQLRKAGHKVRYEHVPEMGGWGVDDILNKFKNDSMYKGTVEGAEKYKKFKEKTDKWSPRKKDEYHSDITDDWGQHHNPDVEDFYELYYGVEKPKGEAIVDFLKYPKKAEGGRIGLGTGGPPLQFGIAEADWEAKHPVQGNKISQLKDAAMDRVFPGTGITGSLNMGNFEAFYNQPLIDPMNTFEKSGEPQYGLQYDKGGFEAGIGVMPSGETAYGARFKKNIDFNKMLGVHNRRRQANGGLTKTTPPKRGPMPQGLPSALYNGIMRPRSY